MGLTLSSGWLALPGVVLPTQLQAQTRIKALQPTPAVPSAPSSADIVNKLLSPGPSDPNVPLPHPDLTSETGAGRPALAESPQIFGRREEGGGIVGFKVPFPADRGPSGTNTRYSSGPTGANTTSETR